MVGQLIKSVLKSADSSTGEWAHKPLSTTKKGGGESWPEVETD